jgi:ribonuclease VapC
VIVGSSAVVAVLLREPGWERLTDRLADSATSGIGAPTLVETGIVLSARRGLLGKTLLARFVQEGGLTTVPFTEEHWHIATDACLRFGKGRHPAALNFGDCLTYAVARLANEPLLCIGKDFAQTDLELIEFAE